MKFLVQNNQIIEGPLSNYPKTFELEDVIHPIREMANKGHDVTQYGWVEDTTAEPTYDPSTHKLGDITYSVVDGQVVGEYEVLSLSTEELRRNLQAVRDQALMDMTHTFADGSVIQVRPTDLTNFNIAISVGLDRDWIMADNSVRLTTAAEMQEALNSGIGQGQAIWNNYAQALKAI